MSRLLTPLFVLMLSCLTGCENFDYTFNERIIHTTRPLLSDFEIADRALEECLLQTIHDERVTSISQLTELNCSNAGITQLTGLGQFTALERLRLSSNQVRNLLELKSLVQLEELYLDDNRVVDAVPLAELHSLRHLDLSGNPALQCPEAGILLAVSHLTLPRHCR